MNKIQKAITNPKLALDTLIYRMFKPLGHRNFKRFILLSRSRTGSNMLLSFINSHPNIYAQGEIFRNLNGRNYKDILGSAFSKQPYYIKATGFKLFYYHPQDFKDCGLWEDLENMQNLHVIHLKRRNILRVMISRKIAGFQDSWYTTRSHKTGSTTKKSVSFTIDELEEKFKKTRSWEEDYDRRFANHPILNVHYEDIVSDPENEFRKITGLLELQYVRPKTKLKRQNPEKLYDLITNYEDLKSAFDGTKWQHFFDD